ncbi:MAG: D-2-hydroxyacid dehydrogenase [Bacteroidota bacterium]
MKILANDGIEKSAQLKLESAGFTISVEKIQQEKLAEAINENNFSVLLVRSATQVRKNVIDACPNLKLIGRGGVGMDNIDVEYARSKGIKVINTPAASAFSVAELVFAHLFSMARFIYDANREMPVKGEMNFNDLKKKYGKGIELRGKTLGIIGIGSIGQIVAKYALGCGMKVIAYDPFVKEATIDVEIFGAKNVSIKINTIPLNDVLAQSDFITLHVPKQKDGKAVIGNDELNKIKKGGCIVNTSRGGIIDESALIEALNTGKIAHAALDVFVNEPTPKKEVLQHPKISLTPHIGAATAEAQERVGSELAQQIIEWALVVAR